MIQSLLSIPTHRQREDISGMNLLVDGKELVKQLEEKRCDSCNTCLRVVDSACMNGVVSIVTSCTNDKCPAPSQHSFNTGSVRCG